MERMGRLTLLLSTTSEFYFLCPPLLSYSPLFLGHDSLIWRSDTQYRSWFVVIRYCGMAMSDPFLFGIPAVQSNPFEDTQSLFTPFENSHLPILSFHYPCTPSINPSGSILSTSPYKPALTPATKQLIETNTLVYSLLPTWPSSPRSETV